MQINRRTILKYGFLILLALFALVYPGNFYNFFMQIIGVIMPLILGGVLAYALNILVKRIEKHFFPHTKWKWLQKSRRGWVILISFIIIILILAIVFRLVIPQFVSALTDLFKSVPSMVRDVAEFAEKLNKDSALSKQINSININWSSVQSKVMKFFTSGATSIFSSSISIVTSVAKGLFNFILAVTFAIYILSAKEKLGRQVANFGRAFIKEKHRKNIKYVLDVTDDMFSSFIAGQVVEAFILGSLTAIGMLIFRFPYALPVGAFIGVTALIPIIGAWLGGAVGLLLIAAESPLKAVLFIVFIIVLQQIESNLIYPRVVGNSIGLPGIWVLAAITIGGGLAGIVGMLIGVPIFATIYKLMTHEIRRRLNKKDLNEAPAKNEQP